MICPMCNSEMNPINIERSVLECLKCCYRQHIYLPDLNLDFVRADIDQVAANDLPIPASSIFKHGDDFNDA